MSNTARERKMTDTIVELNDDELEAVAGGVTSGTPWWSPTGPTNPGANAG